MKDTYPLKRTGAAAWFVLLNLLLVPQLFAVEIVVDFTYDTFFKNNPVAVAAIEAAAKDLSDILTTELPAYDKPIERTGGQLTYGLHTTFGIFGFNKEPWKDPGFKKDEIRIYIEGVPISGPTIGIATVQSVNAHLKGEWDLTQPHIPGLDLQTPVIAEATEVMRRAGPVEREIDLRFDRGILETGIFFGKVKLDTISYWHYEHDQPVERNHYDLYTAALHEIVHCIGFSGSVKSYRDNHVNGLWQGPHLKALNGGWGGGIIDDHGHFYSSYLRSTAVNSGQFQYAVMGPAVRLGERRYLTEHDLAVLKDVGWEADPSPTISAIRLSKIKYGAGHPKFWATAEVGGDTSGVSYRWRVTPYVYGNAVDPYHIFTPRNMSTLIECSGVGLYVVTCRIFKDGKLADTESVIVNIGLPVEDPRK